MDLCPIFLLSLGYPVKLYVFVPDRSGFITDLFSAKMIVCHDEPKARTFGSELSRIRKISFGQEQLGLVCTVDKTAKTLKLGPYKLAKE